MSVDIGADLLLAITEAFQKAYDQDITIRVLEKRLNGGKAHLEDAARYSERVGELLANVYGELLSSEVLPNGRMYWNIAQKVIQEPLVNNYNLVAEASVNALTAHNAENGVGLRAQKPALNQERITGLMNKVSDAEQYDDVAFALDEPVKNFSRSVVDDAVKTNADFQAKAGMDVKIVRSTTGSKTCDWCRRLAGTYDYADVRKTGHDVWKRHAYCDCRIEYVSSSERYDVENYKKITKSENREKVAERKALQTADDRTPEKIAARKALAGVGERTVNMDAGQNYEEVTFGRAENRKRGSVTLTGRMVESSAFDVWVSDKVRFSRRSQHMLDKELKAAFDKLPSFEGAIKPEVLVMDAVEFMTSSSAAYNAVTNQLYINAAVFEKATREKLAEDFVGGNKIATTFYHEVLHWHDAWMYIQKGNTITAETYADYMVMLNERAKELLDSVGITADNVGEISRYAKVRYDDGIFDEAYTEYRVKQRSRKG